MRSARLGWRTWITRSTTSTALFATCRWRCAWPRPTTIPPVPGPAWSWPWPTTSPSGSTVRRPGTPGRASMRWPMATRPRKARSTTTSARTVCTTRCRRRCSAAMCKTRRATRLPARSAPATSTSGWAPRRSMPCCPCNAPASRRSRGSTPRRWPCTSNTWRTRKTRAWSFAGPARSEQRHAQFPSVLIHHRVVRRGGHLAGQLERALGRGRFGLGRLGRRGLAHQFKHGDVALARQCVVPRLVAHDDFEKLVERLRETLRGEVRLCELVARVEVALVGGDGLLEHLRRTRRAGGLAGCDPQAAGGEARVPNHFACDRLIHALRVVHAPGVEQSAQIIVARRIVAGID